MNRTTLLATALFLLAFPLAGNIQLWTHDPGLTAAIFTVYIVGLGLVLGSTRKG